MGSGRGSARRLTRQEAREYPGLTQREPGGRFAGRRVFYWVIQGVRTHPIPQCSTVLE